MHILNGKKILMIGNSFTYYGNCVVHKGRDILDLESRQNDEGYFYQICKSNGADVSVVNWTWDGHALRDTFGEKCEYPKQCMGVNHFSYLTDLVYDYVYIQEGTRNLGAESSLEICKNLIKIFKEANPDVKFIFPVHVGYYILNGYADVYANVPEFEKLGMSIVGWGRLVNDIIKGNVLVPNGKETYNKNSFIVNQSEKDGFHPNMLSGYITALMTYCVITGESAVGKDYSFCTDTCVNPAFNVKKYCDTYYTYDGATTNFPSVFASPEDMRGIQELIDKYIAEKLY